MGAILKNSRVFFWSRPLSERPLAPCVSTQNRDARREADVLNTKGERVENSLSLQAHGQIRSVLEDACMWKNVWPLLVLGGLGYALYTGWNPLAGTVHPKSPGMQAAGPGVVREVQQMPQMMHDMGGNPSSA